MRHLGFVTAMMAAAAIASTCPPVQEYRISRRDDVPEPFNPAKGDHLARDTWRTRNRPNRKARR